MAHIHASYIRRHNLQWLSTWIHSLTFFMHLVWHIVSLLDAHHFWVSDLWEDTSLCSRLIHRSMPSWLLHWGVDLWVKVVCVQSFKYFCGFPARNVLELRCNLSLVLRAPLRLVLVPVLARYSGAHHVADFDWAQISIGSIYHALIVHDRESLCSVSIGKVDRFTIVLLFVQR